ncbi:MAG: ANTAR domain-containing protein [Ruminococcus sp.]|nr:ANTAR domain-containing protein [Ruminococcus sp.]
MSLKSRMYSILVVSSAENFNTALLDMLPDNTYHSVFTVSNINSAKRELSEKTYDFVVINAPVSGDIGTQFAIDICCSKQTVVLIFVKNEIYAEIYDKVVNYGVFTLPKPVPKQVIAQALSWMISARERLRLSEKKTLSIEEKMLEIRIVNRAKWLLISELKMDEHTAHRYIEKQAMDLCISKKEVADNIIKTYS